jgi:drug/metabolite transporter (DMT)-like permease
MSEAPPTVPRLPQAVSLMDPIGASAVMVAAMLFATKGIFAKHLYDMGVSVEAVVTVRAVLALPLFWWFAIYREGLRKILDTPREALIAAAAVGALCYYFGALIDFIALTMIDASIERVLIFSYPAMVVIVTCWRDRAWPSPAVTTATLLTYLGIFFTMGGFDLIELKANLLGAMLVIGSAMTYTVYFLISEKYTRQIGSSRFALFAMTAAPACLVPHFLWTQDVGSLSEISASGWALLLALGVLCMFFPALLQAEGVRRIGAQLGAVLSTAGPPTTVVIAWLTLDERLNLWQWLGMALIVLGILALDLARSRGALVATPSSSQ